VSVTDECIGKVIEAARAKGGTVIVTSDHGNAEQMLDPDTGAVQTAHTTNDVECVLVNDARKDTTKLRPHGVLADIGPTLLELLGLRIPPPVTAESLIQH
jgi:2,3-bisphosphoglycerate-independent phosphoglycerate mutase